MAAAPKTRVTAGRRKSADGRMPRMGAARDKRDRRIGGEAEMAVVRREIDRMGTQRLAMPGDLDLERRHAVEPGGKTADEAAGYVLDNQNGNGKVVGELGEDVLQRRRPAGRGGNGDHAMTQLRHGRRRPAPPPPAAPSSGAPARTCDRAATSAVNSARTASPPGISGTGGGRLTVSAPARSAWSASATSRALGAVGQNHDRCRAFDHDPLGRLDAVALGQGRVHEQNVRTQPAHLVERGNAVARLGDDRERGIGLERAGNG